MNTKLVYFFGDGEAEGGAELVDLLGGKGSNLHEMNRLGVPVPPGFTLSTEVCRFYNEHDREYPAGLREAVDRHLERLAELMGRGFGDPENPLLVSVRSGAPVSMPGMMDSILNLGLNESTVEGLARETGKPRFAYDCYRRLVQMYGEVVEGIDAESFDSHVRRRMEERGAESEAALSAGDWRTLADRFREIYREEAGQPFPEDPEEQLWGAIDAVFASWDNPRAVKWREINDLAHDVGTAVNVQAMVFGNRGEESATGVAFTRDPSTGKDEIVGEVLFEAQGEDVVSGARTPWPLNDYERERSGKDLPSLEERTPETYDRLARVLRRLEEHYQDVQDVEFTVEEGNLYILQTRTGKRTATAMVKVAHDMAEEGLISREKAVRRVGPDRLVQILHPRISAASREEHEPVATGLGASPGAAAGRVVFSADAAEERAAEGEAVLLVREMTSPDDVGGMNAAEGVLTSRGGSTSHAAVVARGMGKPCLVGCDALEVDAEAGVVRMNEHRVSRGEWVTLDGTAGEVFLGRLDTEPPSPPEEFEELARWADELRRLGVRANAETPEEARLARELGAEGIGLCRTEHMFFGEDRLDRVREIMLLSPEVERIYWEGAAANEGRGAAERPLPTTGEISPDGPDERRVVQRYRTALDEVRAVQRDDFTEVLRAMAGQPVAVRLLDPPLHEFLPREEKEVERLAERLEIPADRVRAQVRDLSEQNPMLGHRGARLGMTYPDIYAMQVRALAEAVRRLRGDGVDVSAQIMIPLVGFAEELRRLRRHVEAVLEEASGGPDGEPGVPVGTMIELPRSALVADEIAEVADFFSFGTNDLTQTSLGISRDDAGHFLDTYKRLGVITENPFTELDRNGVGALVRTAVERGRETNPGLEVGICGEHGGDPASIRFCHEAGLDYVSCSPYRVPVARIAAAQAATDVTEDVTGY